LPRPIGGSLPAGFLLRFCRWVDAGGCCACSTLVNGDVARIARTLATRPSIDCTLALSEATLAASIVRDESSAVLPGSARAREYMCGCFGRGASVSMGSTAGGCGARSGRLAAMPPVRGDVVCSTPSIPALRARVRVRRPQVVFWLPSGLHVGEVWSCRARCPVRTQVCRRVPLVGPSRGVNKVGKLRETEATTYCPCSGRL